MTEIDQSYELTIKFTFFFVTFKIVTIIFYLILFFHIVIFYSVFFIIMFLEFCTRNDVLYFVKRSIQMRT